MPKTLKKYKLRSPKQFPHATAWAVESDYRQKLAPKDKRWLDRFNEAEFGNNPQLLTRSKKKKRAVWRDNYSKRQDILNQRTTSLDCVDSEHKCGGINTQEDVLIAILDAHKAETDKDNE